MEGHLPRLRKPESKKWPFLAMLSADGASHAPLDSTDKRLNDHTKCVVSGWSVRKRMRT